MPQHLWYPSKSVLWIQCHSWSGKTKDGQGKFREFYQGQLLDTLDWRGTPFPVAGVVPTRQSLTAARQATLSCGSTADSPQSRMWVLTHSAQVFRGLPRPLLPGTTRFPAMPMPVLEGARSTCPAHRNLPQRTVVMSARPSFSSSWSEGMSLWALTPT